jgi:hypothetical protein
MGCGARAVRVAPTVLAIFADGTERLRGPAKVCPAYHLGGIPTMVHASGTSDLVLAPPC